MSLTYLSTLRFDDGWLADLRDRLPGLEVRQITTDDPATIPVEVWREVDVLHTSAALPDPSWAPRLKLVQLDTSGVDHVTGSALWASGIPIASLGGIAGVPMAEYVLMCVLALAHRLPALLAARAAHEWPPPAERLARFTPLPLPGSTMVIVGYGRIGSEVARIAAAFGIRVIGVRRRPDVPEPHSPTVRIVGLADLNDVLPLADQLVILLPVTAATRGCLDANTLARLRPGTTVVNASRGGIIDTAALIRAVHAGLVAGAALDVFDIEPLPAGDPLWDDPQILLTPHVAGFAPLYAEGVARLVTENVRRLVAGQPMLNLVDRAAGY